MELGGRGERSPRKASFVSSQFCFLLGKLGRFGRVALNSSIKRNRIYLHNATSRTWISIVQKCLRGTYIGIYIRLKRSTTPRRWQQIAELAILLLSCLFSENDISQLFANRVSRVWLIDVFDSLQNFRRGERGREGERRKRSTVRITFRGCSRFAASYYWRHLCQLIYMRARVELSTRSICDINWESPRAAPRIQISSNLSLIDHPFKRNNKKIGKK